MVKNLAAKEGLGTIGLIWQNDFEVEETLAKLQLWVQEPKLVWLVLSK